jgi:hypothetical protein
MDEVSDELYEYILIMFVKGEGKNGPVPVAGPAVSSVPVCQYRYCKNFI